MTLPIAAWSPTEEFIKTTHIAQCMMEQGFTCYRDLHQWSVNHYSDFWQTVITKLNIRFDEPYSRLIDLTLSVETPKWLVDAKLNIVNSCFPTNNSYTAIISQTEQGTVVHTSLNELDQFSNRVANSVSQQCKVGDRIAIVMPMTPFAVAIYLGVIKAGCVVVAIPESFSAEEIAIRLQIAPVKLVFCQDKLVRDGKSLPLYEKIVDAYPGVTVVLPIENSPPTLLRSQDMYWENFLVSDISFSNVSCQPDDPINILFSSGTTGEPKAIPWSHISPIKCGSDAYFHHDLKPGDIFCWPSSLGWMMGPWLIFACLLNRATIALYEGTPNNKAFGKFVQDNKITHLGVVPTLVKTWRHSRCMEGLDWSAIKLFTSTGERSNAEDMLYLMSLANTRPIIEYCGGTEIAGAYITGTLVQPAAPAAFTTPALGLDFVILDEHQVIAEKGEVALKPPSIGLSSVLLNKSHHEIYYQGMPFFEGIPFRRHGDQLERCKNGFYRLLGRVDDTMKLAGIKISSAEIETVLNILPGIQETAAIAVNPREGGPSQLIIYVVLMSSNQMDAQQLKIIMQQAIKQKLNPLFKIHDLMIVDSLPRTASNKMMRRVLREQYRQEKG